MVVQQAALIALNDLGPAVGKSRVLCEGLWGRTFLMSNNSASDKEQLRMSSNKSAHEECVGDFGVLRAFFRLVGDDL